MKINVKYFASVREAVGTGQETLELPDGGSTVGAVRSVLVSRGGVWEEALGEGRAVRMACKQMMCGPETPVDEGAEVAFFPPVTGG